MAAKKAPTKKAPAKKAGKLGDGSRFAKLEKSIEAKGQSPDAAKAIAAKAGMEKYGKGKMESMAAKGKARKKAAKK